MASAGLILDEAHLARQTFGDAALEREVLALFAEQLGGLAPRIAAARGAERDALLHRLKGSARAVGAMGLGKLAEEMEGAEGKGEADDALGTLLAATLCALSQRLG